MDRTHRKDTIMARETMADLRVTIAVLRGMLDDQYVVQIAGQTGTVPASLREIAQCAVEGTVITVHGKVGRGVYA
jgi:hypothetical protein